MADLIAGSLTTEIRADPNPAQAGLKQAEANVKAAAGQMSAAGTAVGTSFSEATVNINKSAAVGIGAITGLLGKFVALGGVVGTFYTLGQKIREHLGGAFESVGEKVDAFKLKLDLSDLKGSVASLESEIAGLSAKLETLLSEPGNMPGTRTGDVFARVTEPLKAEIAALTKIRDGLARADLALYRGCFGFSTVSRVCTCLLYTSDAADE